MDEMFKGALLLGPGVALAFGAYLLYLGATKGLPAAKAKASSWWNAAKKDVASVKGDVASLTQRVGAIEQHLNLKPPAPATAAPAPAAAAAPATPA